MKKKTNLPNLRNHPRRLKPHLPIHKVFGALIVFLLGAFALAPPVHAREMESLPIVKLQSLDKITARTMTFEARVGSTVKFGPLYIKIQSCQKAPPVEPPEAAAFLQIWEVKNEDKAEWIFSGWMFASSPALSSMDHAIYDVWVLDCLERKSDELPPPDQQAKEGEGEIAEDQVPAPPAPDGQNPAPITETPPVQETTPQTETPATEEPPTETPPPAAPEEPSSADDGDLGIQ